MRILALSPGFPLPSAQGVSVHTVEVNLVNGYLQVLMDATYSPTAFAAYLATQPTLADADGRSPSLRGAAMQ